MSKKQLAAGMLVGTLGIIVYLALTHNSTLEVENVPTATSTATSTEEVVEELDVVEEAQKELERINAELDAEESRLLQEREAIDTRLEQIRETRVFFQ